MISGARNAQLSKVAKAGAATPSRGANPAMAYAPFGEGYAGGQQWIQFTSAGNAWTVAYNENQTGSLEDFMFRRYSPSQSRWISPAPAGLAAVDPTNPQTWNRYAYVANNPLSFVDPLGLYLSGPNHGCEQAAGDPCGGSDLYGGGGGGGGMGGFCDASGDCGPGTGIDGGFPGVNGVPWNWGPGYIGTITFGIGPLQQALAQYVAYYVDGELFLSNSGFYAPNVPANNATSTITLTFRLITKSDYCRGGDRTILYQLVDTSTGAVPSSNWWVTEHIQASVPTNSGGTNDTPNQYLDWLSNGGTPYNALQSFTVSQGSGAPSYPVYVTIGGKDYGKLGLWMSNNPLRNGQPSPNSVNCPPQ